MTDGWIKLHRKMKDCSFYTNSQAVHVWIECLFRASHANNSFYSKRQEIKLQPGQFLMGREEFGKSIGISGSTAWFWINKFKADNQIDIKTSTKGTLVSIIKWKDYQILDNEVDSKKTAKKQQKNTNKNYNNNTNFVSIGKSPKSYGDKIINTIIQEFENLYGFKPIDRYPRRVGQNIKQRFIKKAKEMGVNPKEEAIIKGIKAYFSWVGNQKSLENVKNLDVLRRNTEVFFSRNK